MTAHESDFMLRRRAIMMGTQAKPEKAAPAPISKQSAKKIKELEEDKPTRQKRKAWFEARMKELKGVCTECGHPIKKDIPAFAICAVAHVVPKRKEQFPSIEFHPKNFIELGAECGCHNKYDTSWDDASQMKVWPLIIEKFILLYPSIDPSERKHIPELLRQEVL